MIFNNFEDFLDALRSFNEQYPNSFIEPKDKPENLLIGFHAIADDGTPDGINVEWYIHISKIKNSAESAIKEQDAVFDFNKAKIALSQAQKKYINIIFNRK